jgi:hypothetical protein
LLWLEETRRQIFGVRWKMFRQRKCCHRVAAATKYKHGVNKMRPKMFTLTLTVLALGGAIASTSALAQNLGRPANDGGFINGQGQPATPQYNGAGQVVASPAGETSGGNCSRFRSFDPATGTYMGRDGQRHPCQ